MADKVLEVRNVNKAFPGVQALSDVSFDLYPGEVHVVLGENGAGKSTLMKILTGVYPKDSGEVLLEGHVVNPKSPKEASRPRHKYHLSRVQFAARSYRVG